MKNLYRILTIICALITLHSCDSYLEVTPENSVTFRSYFKTDQDFETYTQGIRQSFMRLISGGNSLLFQRGMYYDECDYFTSTFSVLTNDFYRDDIGEFSWANNYTIIASCNTLREFAKKSDLDPERKAFYQGQADFYAAFSYMYLAKFWGEAPILKEHGEAGLKAKNTIPEVLAYTRELSKKAIASLPYRADLTDALDNSFTHHNVPCKEVAMALYADICSWQGGINDETPMFQEALDTLNALDRMSPFTLSASTQDVVELLLVGDHAESLFEVRVIPSEAFAGTDPACYDRYMSYPLYPDHGKGDVKYKALRITNASVRRMFADGDLRRENYFYDFETLSNEDSLITGGFAYPHKFREIKSTVYSWGTSFSHINQNVVVYRNAGLRLLRAECYARVGNSAAAIADMDEVRTRANAPVYNTSEGDDIRYLVFKEREKEFLFERDRYFDVIRNGYWATEFHGDFQYITEEDVKDGALYYPLTWSAFKDNPLMTQNRFWLKRF